MSAALPLSPHLLLLLLLVAAVAESALSNRLDGLDFHSKLQNCTHEHYIKVVSTRYEYLRRASVNTYQYTVNSHVYQDHVTHEMPAAKFTFDLSPMSVVVSQVDSSVGLIVLLHLTQYHPCFCFCCLLWQTSTPFYKFLTSLCAIIGGVFTGMWLCNWCVDSFLLQFDVCPAACVRRHFVCVA